MSSLATRVIECEDDTEYPLEPSKQMLLSKLALTCRIHRHIFQDLWKPRHALMLTGQALIALARGVVEANIDFACLKDPRLVVTRSMITDGHVNVPESDSIFLVEDGAKGLLGNGSYWLDKNGERLEVPTVPKKTSKNHREWLDGYREWMTSHGVHESSSTMNQRKCQSAYNLSRIPDLAERIPLLHVTTTSYLMEYEGQEVARGEKEHMVKRLFSLQARYGANVEVKVWNITTLRIKKADMPEHITIDTAGG
jgi:hypothetical protein